MRATLDKLISGAGLLIAVLLLVFGGLLSWAHSFIGDQVNTQLSEQHITMPTDQTGLSALPKADQAALSKYAGQPLTTGPQAKAYADHFIAVHLNEASGGKTYSEVSGQYIGQCSDPKAAATKACTDLGSLRQTMFMGSTLRGLLLYGYAFATMGTIAGIAAIGAYIGAVLLFLLAGFGIWHSRRAGHSVAADSQPLGAHA
ncbi:hypothetical protein [Nocardioides cynanchi]|uniref:hypothetical protein n=1 Tax=Nocardioides cynanchi TaxID=2558918 RepID=UPI001247F5B1|nr:hypothetical protein [Nocardioides cynanchi]